MAQRLAVGAGKRDAFMKAHQVGRRIDVCPLSRSFDDGAEVRGHRALAVGSGDVDDGRQLSFGMPEFREQALDAPK